MDDIARVWRKSTHSGNNGGQCVEIAGTAWRTVAVRDSKDPQGPELAFTPETWRAFTRSVKSK